MYNKEEVTEALRIVSMTAIGAYSDGQAAIKDLEEKVPNEELRGLAIAIMIATLEAKSLIKLLSAQWQEVTHLFCQSFE